MAIPNGTAETNKTQILSIVSDSIHLFFNDDITITVYNVAKDSSYTSEVILLYFATS